MSCLLRLDWLTQFYNHGKLHRMLFVPELGKRRPRSVSSQKSCTRSMKLMMAARSSESRLYSRMGDEDHAQEVVMVILL